MWCRGPSGRRVPRGEVALEGGLQTSAVGRPVERVTAVAQTLEAAGGVDADVVAGPREGALVDVCVATGRVRGGVSGWAEGHACPWAPLSAQPTGFPSLPGFLSPLPVLPRQEPPLVFSGGGQGRDTLDGRVMGFCHFNTHS